MTTTAILAVLAVLGLIGTVVFGFWLLGAKGDLELVTEVRDQLSQTLANVHRELAAKTLRAAALDAENMALAESIVKSKRERDEALMEIQRRRAIAKAAAAKGHEVQSALAAAERAKKRDATHEALSGEPWADRDAIVAPVRERRAAKKSGGAVASTARG